jgi:phosphorylcholine metabolism protein LicD
MAGKKTSKEDLNALLHLISLLLVHSNIHNWFIAYGTLLGIVREDSCIQNDDDVDIICDKKYKKQIKELLLHNGFINTIDKRNFIQFHFNGIQVDFYLCTIEKNDFIDNHEKKIWVNCYPLILTQWNAVTLQLPNNPVQRLVHLYGKDWITPSQFKSVNNTII